MTFGWALGKLVQAAVAGGAAQIRFAVSAQDITAKIHFPEVSEAQPQFQEYVAEAAHLARSVSPRRLEWRCQAQTVDLKGEFSPLPAQGPATFYLEHGGWVLWNELRDLLGSRGDAHHLLYQRACLSPVPVFVDAARINTCQKLARWGPHNALRLAPTHGPSRIKMLGLAPLAAGAGRVEFAGRSLVCDLAPVGQVLPAYFLEGAHEPRFDHVLAAPDRRVIPELTHPHALALCGFGVMEPVGDHHAFFLKEQWEWLNPGHHVSLATTKKGDPPSLLVNRWLQFDPDSTRVSELWPLQDGLLLEPILLPQAPSGCRVIAVDPEPQLREQLALEIQTLYRALKSD